MTDETKWALRAVGSICAWCSAVLVVSTAFSFLIHSSLHRASSAPAPATTSFCCDEVLQGAGRCSHVKHTLLRANEAGSLWVCLCDPYR